MKKIFAVLMCAFVIITMMVCSGPKAAETQKASLPEDAVPYGIHL